MIYIENGQIISENENLKVFSPTGYYSDTDLIEYCNVYNPNLILGSFQAQFIKYGGLVYRYDNPKDLGEAILAIDPESTHTSASFVRMQNELLLKLNEGFLEPRSLQEVVSDEQQTMEEKISDDYIGTEEEADSSTENIEDVTVSDDISSEGENINDPTLLEINTINTNDNIDNTWQGTGSNVKKDIDLINSENSPSFIKSDVVSYAKNKKLKRLRKIV